MDKATLLAKIEAHLAKTGMSATYFGKKATGNSELVPRLRAGGGLTLDTAQRVLGFIAEREGTE